MAVRVGRSRFVRALDDGRVPLAGLWTTPLADNHPLETRSAFNGTSGGGVPYATRFANQANYSDASTPVAGYYSYGYSTITDTEAAPIYIIPTANHPRRLVQWVTNNGGGPDADLTIANGLQTHFQSVPVPTGPDGSRFDLYYGRDPQAGSGFDQQLVILNPFTFEMWEFWLFSYNASLSRYECGYGGYAPDYRACEVLPNQWGARATSLPLAGGIMQRREYQAGAFRHPLEVAVPVILSSFIAPATRADGPVTAVPSGDTRDAIPEGAWFRLPASYVVDTTAPKLFQLVTRAARDYGIIVVDCTGGSMTFSMDSTRSIGTQYAPLTSDPVPNPNSEPNPFWGSANVLKNFPWASLVQIQYP